MLTITHIKLRNFCQFSSYDLDVDTGLTRIKAENGAGKTNLFRGIVYGLTSWCDPSVGTQTSLQKDDTGVPGYVELDISVDSTSYTLRRYTVTSAKQADVLMEGDTVVVEKRQRVNTWLEERLPVTLPVLAQLMWLRQGKLDWLLTTSAANINTFLGLIFDTRKLEKLRDCIKTAYDKIATLRADFDVVQKQRQEELDSLPDIEQLEKEYETGSKKLVDLSVKLDVKGITQQEKDTAKTQLTTGINQLGDRLQELDTFLHSNDAGSIELELEDKQNQLKKYTEAKKKVETEFNASYILGNKLKQCLDLLTTDEKLEKCQYCGAGITDINLYRNNKVKNVLQKDIPYEQAIEELKANIETATQAGLAANKQLSEYTKLINDLNHSIPDLQNLLVSITAGEAEATQLKQQIDHMAKQLADIEKQPVVDVDKKALTVEISRLTEGLKTVQQVLADSKAKKAYCEKVIAQCEVDRKSYARNTYVKSLLTRLRDVLSQSRAQARYISSKVDLINAHIASYMELSEMPFTVRLHPTDHIFVYTMKDSDIEHPAAMLSGAQMAAAAISIQMALAAVAAPELSLLLVDEADAALSPENKVIAARLYRTLTDSVAGTVFVISHAEAVSEDCDRIVELCK